MTSPEFAGTEARATADIVFTRLAPNSAGVVTDLLIQPLPSAPSVRGSGDEPA